MAAALLFFLASAAHARWVTLAPNHEPRQEVAAAVANEKVYLIGGIANGFAGPFSATTVEVYDPLTDSWTFAAPLPESLHHPAAATHDDQVYVFGGYRTLFFDATDSAYRYDPALDRWFAIAPLPFRRAAHAAVTVGDRIFIVGGVGPSAAVTLAYDPILDRWTSLAPIPTPREHLAAAAINGKVYVAGGRIGNNLSLNQLEEYNPATNSWRSLAPMPTGRSGIAAAILGGRMYVFGGEGNRESPSGIYPQTESYDPAADEWRSEDPMPTGRHGIGAVAIGRTIYVPGGATQYGFGVTDAHEAFVLPLRARGVRR